MTITRKNKQTNKNKKQNNHKNKQANIHFCANTMGFGSFYSSLFPDYVITVSSSVCDVMQDQCNSVSKILYPICIPLLTPYLSKRWYTTKLLENDNLILQCIKLVFPTIERGFFSCHLALLGNKLWHMLSN